MQEHAPAATLKTDVAVLCALASLVLVLHAVVGNGYGFHRDELQTLDDARHLAPGFVAYPPLTAIAGRIAIALFGISPWVFRLPAAVINAVSLVLVGLTAREMGGLRLAQAVALLMCLPVAVVFSTMLQYNTFDYLAWALATFFTARLLRTGDARWWIGVGAAIGIGALSKYSIALLAASIVAGVIALPSQRYWLRSRWFYLGMLTTLLVASPNLIWLIVHHFITLQMEQTIHARDVRIGRAAGYWTDQLKFNLLALPLAVAGIVSLLRNTRFRLLAFFFFGPLVLFAVARGRGYYLLPAYIAPNAAAGVALERWLTYLSTPLPNEAAHPWRTRRHGVVAVICIALLADAAALGSLFVQIGRPGSAFFQWQVRNNDDIGDETGWPEFVNAVADAYRALPPADRGRLAILADNYGEAGALALYGPSRGLPEPISQVNSFWARGYGPFPPENVLATGQRLKTLAPHFESCRLVGEVHIPYGVRNEEAHKPEIYLCHHLLGSWDDVWRKERHFG
jgi:hypothetical protein